MHTLIPSATQAGFWDVVYSSNYGHLQIQPDMHKDDAMRLVNYLNGGSGSAYIPPSSKGSHVVG